MSDAADLETEEAAPRQEASTLPDERLFETLQAWFLYDQQHSSEWRKQAKKDLDFATATKGEEQWGKAAETLTDEQRTPIVFNLVQPILKAVAGVEINTRQEQVYLPRNVETDDLEANEGLTEASNWMADGCSASQHESRAFQDAGKCGMGWVEERLDYELDPDGKYVEERVYPLEMYWDADSRQMNLADSRRRWRAKNMTLTDARALFPGKKDEELHCSWALGIDTGAGEAKPIELRRLKQGESEEIAAGKVTVTIIQCQWWEREAYWRAADPFTGELKSYSKEEYKQLEARVKAANEEMKAVVDAAGNQPPLATGGELGGMLAPAAEPLTYEPIEIDSVQQVRRVYKTAFIGSKILKQGPNARADGFTWQCVTGEAIDTKRIFVGLVAAMRDPQMMLNKWLSQATHIINSTAKGGILAESDAFDDINEAQKTYAQPQAITIVKKNAIRDGKIMAKPGAGLAAPYFNLIQLAMDAMPRVTGINMELMGLRDANQPGILEAQRKQAAMTILATLFDSLKGMRLEVGRTRLSFIQNHLADGRLIRVLGKNGKHKVVKLMKDKVVGDYDVIIDEAPSSPNQKEQTWAGLQTLVAVPRVQEMMTPEIVVELLDYVPGIPQNLVQSFRKMLEKPPNPDDVKAKQIAEGSAVAKIDRDKAAAEKDRAAAKASGANVVLDMMKLAGEHVRDQTDQIRAVGELQEMVQNGMADAAAMSEELAVGPMGDLGMQLPVLPSVPTEAPRRAPDVMDVEPGVVEPTTEGVV